MKPIPAALLISLLTLSPLYAQTPAAPAPLTISGQTEPSQKVEVPSVLRGQLLTVFVKEGQPIKKDAPIAQLDDEIQKQTVALAQLEADSTVEVRAAETQVDFNRNELERFRKIANVSSPSELRQKELAVKQAELVLEQKKELAAQKKVELARQVSTLNRMTIKSPLDGTVLRIHKQPGEYIDDEKPLAVVVQTRKLNARFFPPRQLFGKIKVGDTIQVDLKTDPAVRRPATVTAVDPVLDAASSLFQITLELDNPDALIPAGISASWTWTDK